MSGKKPYPYQERVRDLLLGGESIILQAPTGAGKTRAALAPFIEAHFARAPEEFPRQCLYSTPMRVLANQFVKEYKGYSESHKRLFRERPEVGVTIQTGERSTDPELMGDLVFTTIDQTLSSFLNVPYALSRRKGNVNVGAVVGAYLVFDEFHLFPHEHGMGALPATVQMLKLLRHTTPFVLMTATFSEKMLERLAQELELDPTEQVVVVPPDELETIDTRWGEFKARQRRFHLRREMELAAGPVVESHKSRSLAVCNTVDRAREIYDGLIAKGCRPIPFADESLNDHYRAVAETRDPQKREEAIRAALEQVRGLIEGQPGWEKARWAMLLHSRFEQPHRAVKETFARAMFGPTEERPWELPSLLLVATQVIEVGLNLTCESLHTEIAPASSVLQRAGRCARFPEEIGDVFVYAVPPDKSGRPNYRPYPANTCERTWEALAGRDGEVVDFATEQEIVDQAHNQDDEEMLKKMREREGDLWANMERAVTQGDPSARRYLIRNVDSRTLLVFEPPEQRTEESPYRMKGFSVYHGTLRGMYKTLREWAREIGLDWSLKYPLPIGKEEEDRRTPTVYQWFDAQNEEDIGSSFIFAVHPQLVAYDAERGFRFAPPDSGEGGQYQTANLAEKQRAERTQHTYRLESYPDHIRIMTRLYERQLRDTLAHVGRRLEAHPELQLPPGALDRAIRLAIALHDVGKLQEEWQQWARNYQRAIGSDVPDYLMAHTLSETEEHRQKEKDIKPTRPNHAGEGAMAGAKMLARGLGKPELARAALTAIARHHSPQASSSRGYRLHPLAGRTVRAALEGAGCDAALARHLTPELSAPKLEKYVVQTGEWVWWLIYFLIVRSVRLTDGESQSSEKRQARSI